MRTQVHWPSLLPCRCKEKEAFSTTEVAFLFMVAPRTVRQWFDSGRLGGTRHGRSRRRQVPRQELIDFAMRYNLPVPEILGGDSEQPSLSVS
jgi:excisionase family DNA binding protein